MTRSRRRCGTLRAVACLHEFGRDWVYASPSGEFLLCGGYFGCRICYRDDKDGD